MAGLRDRPLMRDALLAGVVVAAGSVAALIAVDRGQIPRPHFGYVASAPMPPDGEVSTSRKSSAATELRGASSAAGPRSQQIGAAADASKKKTKDMTLLVMVPDLPRVNPDSPPSGV